MPRACPERLPWQAVEGLDQFVFSGDPEIAALRLAHLTARLESGEEGFDPDAPRGLPWHGRLSPPAAERRAEAERVVRAAEAEECAAREAEGRAGLAELERALIASRSPPERQDDVPPPPGAAEPPPPAADAGEGGPRVTWR